MSKKTDKIKELKGRKGADAQPAEPVKPAKPAAASKTVSGTGLTPWISFRTGVIIITVCSVGMAVLTAIQYVPVVGWLEGIGYALLYGAVIWAIFFLSQLFYRWLRR